MCLTTICRKYPKYTWSEIEKHNTVDDCWTVIRGNVYDITDYAKVHHGGDIIYKYAGKTADDVFECYHYQSRYRRMMSKYKIGRLSILDNNN